MASKFELRYKENMDIPFFTIVIATCNSPDFLKKSLESIEAQQGVNVEVILIDASVFDHCLEIAEQSKVVTQTYSMVNFHRYKMYNKGLQLANGKYIHFFYSGDFFLSCTTLKQLQNLIEKTNDPDAVFGSGINYDMYDGRRKVKNPISKQSLHLGMFATDLPACCFNVQKLKKMKGFNPDFIVRGGFELLSRYHTQTHMRFITTNRVLTDHQFMMPSLDEYVRYNLETPRIILKYFGFWNMLYYLITHNYFLILRYWGKSAYLSYQRK
jgi:glycosyltransferase involved in cell wall biosynthesis